MFIKGIRVLKFLCHIVHVRFTLFFFFIVQLILQTWPPLFNHPHTLLRPPQTFQTSSSWQNQPPPQQKHLHRSTGSTFGPAATWATLTPASTVARCSTCPAYCGGTPVNASRGPSSASRNLRWEAEGADCSFTRRAAAPSVAPCATGNSTAWRTSRLTFASTRGSGPTPARCAPSVSVTLGRWPGISVFTPERSLTFVLSVGSLLETVGGWSSTSAHTASRHGQVRLEAVEMYRTHFAQDMPCMPCSK